VKTLWKHFVLIFYVVPPAGIFMFNCVLMLMSMHYHVTPAAFESVVVATVIGTVIGGYPIMVFIGIPMIYAMECFRLNGLFMYLLAASLAGVLWALFFSLLIGGFYWRAWLMLCVFGVPAGFFCGLLAYLIMHYVAANSLRTFRHDRE
jgi:hypothetical protein